MLCGHSYCVRKTIPLLNLTMVKSFFPDNRFRLLSITQHVLQIRQIKGLNEIDKFNDPWSMDVVWFSPTYSRAKRLLLSDYPPAFALAQVCSSPLCVYQLCSEDF